MKRLYKGGHIVDPTQGIDGRADLLGDGKRIAAIEVMLNTPYITELVKKGDVSAIKEAIVASSERGVQSFDVALLNLYKQNRIELEEALANADSRSNLEAKINFG